MRSGKCDSSVGSWCTAMERRSSPTRPDASVTRRRNVTVYCSLVSKDLVDEMLNAAFQNDDGIFERSTAPNEPSNGALPEPVPPVMKALSVGSAPGANSSFHV